MLIDILIIVAIYTLSVTGILVTMLLIEKARYSSTVKKLNQLNTTIDILNTQYDKYNSNIDKDSGGVH